MVAIIIVVIIFTVLFTTSSTTTNRGTSTSTMHHSHHHHHQQQPSFAYTTRYQPDVTKYFRGMLRSTVTCLECRHQSTNTEEFLDISVPIGVSAHKAKTGGGLMSACSTLLTSPVQSR